MCSETCTYEEFKLDFIERIYGEYGKEGEIDILSLNRINGVLREGISLKNPGDKIAPLLCLDHYYDLFRSGISMESLLDSFRSIVKEQGVPEVLNTFDYDNYSQVTDHIAMKLINRERNEDRLLELPHRIFYDLAVVYYILLEDRDNTMFSATIDKEMMDNWEMDEAELYDRALTNAPVLNPHVLLNMPQLLSSLGGEETEVHGKASVYVLSNRRNCFGASEILVPGILKEASEKLDGDFWIIPSSVHEMLLVPASLGFDALTLESMVCDVNRTCLEPEIVLGEHVYYYSRVTGIHGEFYR